MTDYNTADIEGATVITGVPYREGTEFREYDVDADNLVAFLETMNQPMHAEKVINVELERHD